MNLFEKASRKGLAFPSDRGTLITDQLWHLDLPALDTIAKGVNQSLKEVSEESFVSTTRHPDKPAHTLRLEILKHIIAVKLQEIETRKTSVERAEKRRKIIDAIAVKEGEELTGTSKKKLLAQLAELDG